MRGNKMKLIGLVFCVLLVITSAAPVMAADFYERKHMGAHWMAWDSLIVRPLSAVETVLGAGLWVLSMPTIGRSQSGDVFTETYIDNPFTFGFERPTGQFNTHW